MQKEKKLSPTAKKKMTLFSPTETKKNQGADVALYIIGIVFVMLGLSYISVPLYQLFCQTYGLGGTVQLQASPGGANYNIELQADCKSSVNNDIPPKKTEEPNTIREVSEQKEEARASVLVLDKKSSSSRSSGLTVAALGKQAMPNACNFQGPIKIYEQVTAASVPSTRSQDNSATQGGGGLSPQEIIEKAKEETRESELKPLTIYLSVDNSKDLPWTLSPGISKIKVYPGDTALTFYSAKNLSNEAVTGVATYNIIPNKAGVYFNKIQCFCFEEQRLKGGESVELPILFFIDSDFLKDPKMKDIDSLTLSYTFFVG